MPPLTQPRRRPLAVLAVASALAVAVGSSGAASADETERCISQHEQSQALRRAGKLREARATLLACAAQACPAQVRADCGAWIAEVDASLPSLVFAAKDATTGLDVVDARVLVDGEVAAERLDGKAIQVDPGVHTVRVVRVGSPPVERQVVTREGERNRLVSFLVGAPPDATSSPQRPTPSRTLPLVFGGISAVGWASFAYFGVSGRQRYDSDLTGCGAKLGGCTSGEIDAVRARLIAADVSLGVAVVSLGVATYFWLAAPSGKKSAPAAATPAAWSVRF